MPTVNNALVLREVINRKLTIQEMDGDLLYLATTLSGSRADGIIQVTGSSFDASNVPITGSTLSLINLTDPTATHVLTYNTTTKQVNYTASNTLGGSGTPGAPAYSVQFNNNAGAFGGNANFTFVNNNTVLLTGSLIVSGSSATEVKFANLQENLIPTSSVMIDESTGKLSYINFWYSQSIGDNSATSFNINHNLGTRLVHVSVYSASGDYEQVYPDIFRTTVNQVQLQFAVIPTTLEYVVYISR